MRKIYLDELKKIQLEILKMFSKHCEENGLTYFLFGGTALGAARHQGYIPWDDDIDVAMPRSDYERFVSSVNIGNLQVLTPYNNKEYIYPFAKLVNPMTVIQERTSVLTNFGIYIDIFPIDYISKSKVRRYYNYRKYLEFLMTCKMAEKKDRSIFKQTILASFRFLLKPISLNSLARKIDIVAKKYSYHKENFAGNLVWGYGFREVMDAKIFENITSISFEGNTFKIMRRFSEYLNNIYGDYMQLPPEEKRVLKHAFRAYWI